MKELKDYLKRNAYDLDTLKVHKENDNFIAHRVYNNISHCTFYFLEKKSTGEFFKTQRLNEPAKKINLNACYLQGMLKGEDL